jgi:hypothetical protein
MTSQKLWRVLKLMALGAISFWLPDTLWHALRAFKFDSLDVSIITLIMPLSLLGAYIGAAKRIHKTAPKGPVGWPMFLGVWLLGGVFMTVGASFSGGGFASPNGHSDILKTLLISLIPFYAFMMSTYDGSLIALLVVSVAAPLIWVVSVSTRPAHPK